MVAEKTILVFGGYGGAGSAISRAVLEYTDADLIVAGRREEEARALAEGLNAKFPGGRAAWARADASDSATLKEPFGKADLVVDAATTVPFVEETARAALEAGADYLEIHYPQEVVSALALVAPEAEAAGITLVTQGGFLPGLPSVLVRWAETQFSEYWRARVYVAMRSDFDPGGAVDEFVGTLGDLSAEVFGGGRWRRAGRGDVRKVDFGPTLGTKTTYPITLAEVRDLPQELGVEELSVSVAGLNWFVDYVVTPLAFALGRVKKGFGRRPLARLMVFGSKRFGEAGEAVAAVLEAEGEKGGERVAVRLRVGHDDVYEFTAMPVAAFLRQYLDGLEIDGLGRPGLSFMGRVVDPVRFLKDLEDMGAKVEVELRGV
ncbi:saccharopine dehydrogenase NADP-binding domain-containing protein [Candidatus Methanocrinis natronophilus]|uniref:Saccharopine dehydrogenase NADP-binding domain-containing protein n=1 Tax=Candidatus Methanocrinis natronophilus TaxID=3033396 RepID=A0ABT5X900_9EURY|nr:saccharopine dehydrogenase NADP-binding domain-containing protein [Candidatus Methanocrinis natronophilus]MDF0591181.1 saccharopine dehydrogenase NADP-binding domain-containing protein [Candidatus Methanocrinis natronophilus]